MSDSLAEDLVSNSRGFLVVSEVPRQQGVA